MDYIVPKSCVIKKIAREMMYEECAFDKLRIFHRVFTWIKNNVAIEFDSKDLNPENVLKNKKGTCLALAILMVTILRAMNFDSNEVFVLIVLHKGENPLEALHAVTVLVFQDGSEIAVGDFIHNDLIRTSLNSISETNELILMFNDEVAYTPSGNVQ
ncbi:MAG: hypothetical protein PWQ72_2092 [Pseudothermotoga sp.]|nr:hypothetical protein [Pseudothermotoga sp.]